MNHTEETIYNHPLSGKFVRSYRYVNVILAWFTVTNRLLQTLFNIINTTGQTRNLQWK